MIRVTDNSAEYERDLRRLMPERKTFVLENGNDAPHAVWVQVMDGFYVFNNEHALALLEEKFRGRLGQDAPLDNATVVRLLGEVGREDIEWLRSYTSETRPPLRSGDPRRRAHPGHWADRTHELNDGHYYRVDDGPERRDYAK